MALRLALDEPGLVRGIAMIAAQPPAPEASSCAEPTGPLSVMLVAGTEDPVSPYAGGMARGLDGQPLGEVRPAAEAAARYAELAGRAPDEAESSWLAPPVAADPVRVERRRWDGDDGHEVRLYTLVGGGHVIPGSSLWFPAAVGPMSANMETAAEVLEFVRALAR